jgi:hypothetical protein
MRGVIEMSNQSGHIRLGWRSYCRANRAAILSILGVLIGVMLLLITGPAVRARGTSVRAAAIHSLQQFDALMRQMELQQSEWAHNPSTSSNKVPPKQ